MIRRERAELGISHQCRPMKLGRSALDHAPVGGRCGDTGLRVSTGGKERFPDDISMERLGRPLKQEAVCLEDIQDSSRARRVAGNRMAFHDTDRRHSSPERRTQETAMPARSRPETGGMRPEPDRPRISR